jgi:hypothetical protein
LYYKNSESIGIKRAFGSKGQVFSFGGKRSKLSEAVLRKWGVKVLAKLREGMSEDQATIWVRAQIAVPG